MNGIDCKSLCERCCIVFMACYDIIEVMKVMNSKFLKDNKSDCMKI